MSRGRWFLIAAGLLAAALVILAVAAPFAGDDAVERPLGLEYAGPGAVTVELGEIVRSGYFGLATFAPQEGRTRVAVEVNQPTGVALPAHLHEVSCEDVSEAPQRMFRVAHRLAPLTGESPRLATSETVLAVPLDELVGRDLAVVVHAGEEPHPHVACADLP